VARIFLAVVCCCTVCSGIGAQPSQTQNQPETALLRTLASPQPVPNESIARQHLKEILSRPEFQEISRAPGLWEQWKRQLAAWILRKFQALFESIAKHPGTGATVFRVSAAAALAMIAFLLIQIFLRTETEVPAASTRQARLQPAAIDWIRAARTASQEDDLNTGIQCLYWAGVVYLQSAGVLPETFGLTPRELVSAAAEPAAASQLRMLASSLERFWYARMPATQEDFTACIRSLKDLGCPVA
jgi:Domain of unknown function (DUF4129)